MRFSIILFSSVSLLASSTLASAITQDDVLKAQEAWGNALVQISQTKREEGLETATKVAESIIDAAYGYNMGEVLFKPTLTEAPQTFRTTKAGALAYFVGQNAEFPKDAGFALKNWASVSFDNAAIRTFGDIALVIGNVHITDTEGNVTTVDKSMGFAKDEKGALRIVLHHSSLPYQP
jgi:hypothetical protein